VILMIVSIADSIVLLIAIGVLYRVYILGLHFKHPFICVLNYLI
jgi:hypothetical protein